MAKLTTSEKEEIISLISEKLKGVISAELNDILKDFNVHIILALQDPKVIDAMAPLITTTIQNVFDEKSKEQNAKIENLEKRIRKLESETEEKDRNSRQNVLILHGLNEKQGEDLRKDVLMMVNDKLEVALPPEAIASAIRIGIVKGASNKPRPILIKFDSVHKKISVYRNKRKLKGLNLAFTENLTPLRAAIYKRIRVSNLFSNYWTVGGDIFVLVNGVKHCLRSFADLQVFMD